MTQTNPRGLRIAMVGQRGLPATYGGVERHVEELGSRLVTMGHEVIVYCRPNYSTDPQADYRGIELRHLNTVDSKHFDAIVHSASATYSAMRDQVDVVHYHALGPGLVAPLPRIFSRAKVVQTVHGLDQQRSKWGKVASSVLGLGCWMSARVPDATVVVSKALKDHYWSEYHAQTTYISNGVDEIDFEPSSELLEPLGLEPGRYVLFVGRLVPEKAPDMLMRAFRRLDRDDLKLAIAGGSSFTAEYVESLEQLAREDSRVVMTGYVHGEQLSQLYAHAGLFVLPSEVEGMPLTLLEAAAHGTPILASDIAPHREMLGESAPGRRMFRQSDEDDLLAQMSMILDDHAGEQEAGQDSRHWVHKEFSWDRAAEELSTLYRRLVLGTRPPGRVVDVTETTIRLDQHTRAARPLVGQSLRDGRLRRSRVV